MREQVNSSSARKKELILNKVDEKAFHECLDMLNSRFKVDDLQMMVNSVREWLADKKVLYIGEDGSRLTYLYVSTYFNLKKHVKEDSLKFLATFFADDYNLSLMVNSFSPWTKDLLKKCVDSFYVSMPEVDKIVGVKQQKELFRRHMDWGNSSYELFSPWFKLSHDGRSLHEEVCLYVYPELYPYFYRMFYPHEQVVLFRDLPEEPKLYRMFLEESAVTAFPSILELYNNNYLVVGTNGKMSSVMVKNCLKYVGQLEEFFPSTKVSGLKNLRSLYLFSYLYYSLISCYLRSSKREVSFQIILKESYGKLSSLGKIMMSMLLSHISGINYKKMDMSNSYYLVSDICEILRDYGSRYETEKVKYWISVDGLVQKILRTSKGFAHLHLFSLTNYHYYNMLSFKNSKTGEENLSYSAVREMISEPFVKGMLLMMASAGILDIAYRDYQNDDKSWVDWLEYIRITDLGRYVLGCTMDYQTHFKKKEGLGFDVDPDHLIVRFLDKGNPFDGYLKEVAKPIGNQRYVFSEESFLRKCVTKRDVENKVEYFKRFIANDFSPLWENFFDQLLEHCHPFKSLSTFDYSLFEVDRKDKRLVHLLNTDEKLRSLVIRAEGFLFLVKNSDKEKFVSRMKTLGFIL